MRNVFGKLFKVQTAMMLFSFCAICAAYVLPMDKMAENGYGQDALEYGVELMREMNVSDNNGTNTYSSWCFPTSMVVRGEVYPVRLSRYVGDFRLMSPTNDDVLVAVGRVRRFHDSMTCRRASFGSLAMSSLGVRTMAGWTTLSHPVGDTNVLFLTQTDGRGMIGVLSGRNVAITMRSDVVSNIVDFTVSLLNAGLPDAERLK